MSGEQAAPAAFVSHVQGREWAVTLGKNGCFQGSVWHLFPLGNFLAMTVPFSKNGSMNPLEQDESS